MKLSLQAEASVVESVRRYPDDHVVWKRELYTRRDGALQVYREGFSEFLHRRLYRLVLEPNLKRQRLERTCDTWGCANPYHFRITGPGARRSCPNGHEYTDENTTPAGHCATCGARRERERAARGTGGSALNAAKLFCPAGHDYSPANTYVYVGARGIHRKCRACNRDRARQRREALATAA